MWQIIIGRGNKRHVFPLDASNWDLATETLRGIIARSRENANP